jgi:2'-5' RNA ligase
MDHRADGQTGDKHVYAVLQFDAQTEMRLRGLYQALTENGFTGTQTKGIPYHITLGAFEPAAEAEVVRRMQEAARTLRAFSLRLTHVDLFGLNVLFIAPAVEQELLLLREAVASCGGSAEAFPWAAHITMLMDVPDAILRAVSVLAERFEPFQATAESIGVYEFFPERRIGVYPLRGSKG